MFNTKNFDKYIVAKQNFKKINKKFLGTMK